MGGGGRDRRLGSGPNFIASVLQIIFALQLLFLTLFQSFFMY